ncbi:MAG: ABC transporter ATP-binding protein [Bacteroidetes bacterium]|nr:ABC transporter ATP-binding protein [Bacteroidota bacterium]
MSESAKGGLDLPLVRRVLGLASPYRKEFYTTLILSILLAGMAMVRPLLVQRAIDYHIIRFDLQGLRVIVLVMLLSLVVETVMRYYFAYIAAWLGTSIIRDLRQRVYSHIIYSRLQYFDTTPIGTSTTRTITDVEAVNDTFSEGLISIFADILTIVVAVTCMLIFNWQLALVSLIPLPFLLLVTRWFQRGVKASFQDERTQIGRLNAFLQEHITGMRIIQIFNVEKQEREKFQGINGQLRDANVRGIWYYSLFFPAVEILLATAIGLMVWFASGQMVWNAAKNNVIIDTSSVGTISLYIMLINLLFRPLRFIADKVNTIQRGVIAAERVFKLLDKDQSIPDTGTNVPQRAKGKIEFDHVWFAYEHDNYVLKDLSFALQAGETLAIVGATGSGKTSTMSLLGRFYEINKGEIKIDDVSIKDYKLSALRQQMSIVLQDVFLFAGSVYDNITLRNENITRETVIAASKAIGAHEFIMRLPGGYDYKVMERGATLSMGQRQLISFVRALVYDPAILILDEATSSIDTESEHVVQEAIEKLVKGRTSVVIAHRLSTIRHAHKIMVLDRGELKEFGSHDQLMQLAGHYKHLYDMQFNQQKEVA